MNLTELISRGGECAYARYAAPSVERVDISVERGFAQSSNTEWPSEPDGPFDPDDDN